MRIQRVVAPDQVPRFSRRLTDVEVLEGLPSVEELHEELLGYANIILGRADPPTDQDSYLDLVGVASAYYARATEIAMLIRWEEQQRGGIRGRASYKVRTGQPRSCIERANTEAALGG